LRTFTFSSRTDSLSVPAGGCNPSLP